MKLLALLILQVVLGSQVILQHLKGLTHEKLLDHLQKRVSFLQTALTLRSAKRRVTMDGRKCAAKFMQAGKVYTDCCTVAAPDGKNSKKEWCYVDATEGGTPNWDYCAPVLDYDTVREEANKLAASFVPEIRKATDLVIAQQGPTSSCAGAYKEVQKEQLLLDKETALLEKQMEALDKIQGQLVKMQGQWEAWEKDIGGVMAEIKALENEAQAEYLENCAGMLGYEKDNPGDGMLGEYYNNEDFLGQPLTQEDMGVDFDWGGQAPMEKIAADNFSVRWTTYLKVPLPGKYQFKTFSDDGCSVYINDKMIVSHFMGVTDGPKEGDEEEEQETSDGPIKSHLESNINNYEEGSKVTPARKSSSWSEEVALTTESPYKLQILYYHSIHSRFDEDARNFFKLFWRSDKFTEVEIHSDYVYQSSKAPALKVMGYNNTFMQLFSLKNDEDAFIDTPIYKINDVPSQFIGLNWLKLPQKLTMPEIKLYATSPILLYVAVDMHKPFPLQEDYKETGEVMSLLRVSKFAEVKQGRCKASQSHPYKIYKKNFMNGPFDIIFPQEEPSDEEEDPSEKKDDDKGGLSLLMWFALDPDGAKLLSCGGLELEVSRNDGPAYKECKTSSAINVQHLCEYAFTGEMIDAPFKTWVTDGEANGAWIEISFWEEYKVTRIVFKNRDNMGERAKEIEVLFSTGEKKMFEVKNTDSPEELKFDPVVTTSLKFTFGEVYTSNNNGGSFQIYGMACSDNSGKKKEKKKGKEEKKEEEEEEDDGEEVKVVPLECKDTMITNEYLVKKKLKPGDSFEAACQEVCAEDKSAKVYGYRTYSEDSSICKAGEHMGVNQKGMRFKVIIERFRNMYESSSGNGISSEGKITNQGSKSITFEALKDDSLVQLDSVKIGTKVDLYQEKKKKWVPAIVKSLDRRLLRMLFVTVGLDGYSDVFDESHRYPSEVIAECGDKITERTDCDEAEEGAPKKKKEKKAWKFCFTQGADCGGDNKGMLADNGGMKRRNEQGLRFGWDMDNTANIRTRGRLQDPLLDNLILFPPDLKSQWCTGAMAGKVACQPLKWTFELPNGAYDVKVTAGDPSFSVGVSINVNDMPLIDAVVLKRNQYFTKEVTVLVGKGTIVIDGICKAMDCSKVWSRMNYVQIQKHTEPKKVEEELAEKLGCGNAYKGGGCVTGTQVENCVFSSLGNPGVHNCGQQYKLVRIPGFYECKDQREMFKCIKNEYKDYNECKKSCPGKCRSKDCLVIPAPPQ